MSFCSTCGAKIENESTQFCSNCGAKISTPVTNSTPVTSSTPVYQPQQTVPAYTPVEPVVEYKMKWYKFLIYFALFFGAFINFVFGFNYITGGIYFVQSDGQVSADMVYNVYGAGLKVLDVIEGIMMIAIAAFGIYTRIRLAKYKANAPMCVYILYGAGAGLTLLYNIALLAVTGLNQLTTVSGITSLAVSVGFVLLNYAYFTKRKSLFVN